MPQYRQVKGYEYLIRENNQKIDRALCQQATLVFFPKTNDEAVFIQERILGMGFAWKDMTQTVEHTDACVETGLVLGAQGMTTHPSVDSIYNGRLCSAEQFNKACHLPLDAGPSKKMNFVRKLFRRPG